MSSLELLTLLKQQNLSHFRIQDVAQLAGVSVNTISSQLKRLEKSGHIVRLKRGLIALPDKIQRFALPAILTAPIPSYVSLYSALFFHGLIEQIPEIIYAITAGRTTQVTNSLATVSFHHVDLTFVAGYMVDPKTEIAMATAEKALVDTLYLQSSRSSLFHKLPELEIPPEFSERCAKEFIGLIPHEAKRKSTRIRLEKILSSGGAT